MKPRKLYYFFIHTFFISGIFYAFAKFIRTPRIEMFQRRLWAYENWIIISFYLLFVYLILTEKEGRFKKAKHRINEFKRILTVNLILLIFPWGLFLIFSPKYLLTMFGMGSIYWRILGIGSLIGAVIYYFPYRFYRSKFTKYVLLFGIIDNFVAGAIVTYLFFMKKVPLMAWSATPLLFYYSYFFKEQLGRMGKN
ncbi:hypothetical protein JXA63_00645 [Candidatus Woesebacteria bacterium]|nr:hypothetical protein [Candidatus Woesebacteria bacterium]